MKWIKQLSFFIIIISYLASCNKEQIKMKSAHSFIKISDPLVMDVIKDFNKEYLFSKSRLDGIPALKIHHTCYGAFIELWLINHWISFNKYKPKYYTYIDNVPLVIFSAETYLFDSYHLDDELLHDLTKDLNVDDMSVPPHSGYGERWLYKLGNVNENIFSVKDTSFKYQNRLILENKINQYVGIAPCI